MMTLNAKLSNILYIMLKKNPKGNYADIIKIIMRKEADVETYEYVYRNDKRKWRTIATPADLLA